MPTTMSVTDLVKFVLKQVAAESNLSGVIGSAELAARLARGANPTTGYPDPFAAIMPSPTRMTDQQVSRFIADFEVVDHRSNDDPRFSMPPEGSFASFNGSGLSATLFRDRTDGSLTLSIRSTEY